MGKLLDVCASAVVQTWRIARGAKKRLVMGASCAARAAGRAGWGGDIGVRAPEASPGLVQPDVSLLLDLLPWSRPTWPTEGQDN